MKCYTDDVCCGAYFVLSFAISSNCISFRVLRCFVRPLVQLRFVSFRVDASWSQLVACEGDKNGSDRAFHCIPAHILCGAMQVGFSKPAFKVAFKVLELELGSCETQWEVQLHSREKRCSLAQTVTERVNIRRHCASRLT